MIIKISLQIILVLALIGCQHSKPKEKQVIKKEYGKRDWVSDSLGVELALNKFSNWKDLLERADVIACNDSVPKITLKTKEKLKTVYFHNPCRGRYGCILIYMRNTIEIHNDRINKADEHFYPLDSLENVLRRDIENNGKNPKLSDSPEKLLIYVSYDKDKGVEKLPELLDQLTDAYERVSNKTNIRIWLYERFEIPPPPPPRQSEEDELIE